MQQFDFLVVGGGIAGLSFALKAAKKGRVAVLFKKGIEESATAWAQGGIAAVTEPDDSFQLHVSDTIRAGAGLCNPEVVEFVVREAPERVKELIDNGVAFDHDLGSDHFHLHQEGGHSRRRIFHAADATGFAIQRGLLAAIKEHPGIQIFPFSSAIDLITTHKLGRNVNLPNCALGVYVLLASGAIEPFLARKILIATGGAGKVYLYTSNPDVATGDGIAMCYRAGARIANMEFYQFHPTCLYHPKDRNFLITEAMRGEGGKLLRRDGTPFMAKYDALAEMAPRDIVARAIDSEMKLHGEPYVLLDISHRPADFVKDHFPNIYERLLKLGIDITRDAIPVVPAAHYCCGGVVSDSHGRSEIENVYVAGECAHTGLHGANRLASNSLLEGLVFAHRAAQDAISAIDLTAPFPTIPAWDPGAAIDNDEQVVLQHTWDEIRRFMWNYVGIVRSTKRLQRALARAEMIEREMHEYYWNFKLTPALLELRNLALVAKLIVRSALERKESRGLHFTLDYPDTLLEAGDNVLKLGVA